MCLGSANLAKKTHTNKIRAIFFDVFAAFKAKNTQNGKILRDFGARRGVMSVRSVARSCQRVPSTHRGMWRLFCMSEVPLLKPWNVVVEILKSRY